MGRGSSGLGKKSGGGGAPAKVNTPSGIDYNQFMAMSEAQRWSTMDSIIMNPNIVVPGHLDDSDTTKVIYALGMDNKPTVVSDDALDRMAGKDLYRTVYDTPNPPPSGSDILDQVRTGDYTQMSGSGGSAHGRAIYFARDDFSESARYGTRGNNPVMMRAKINPNAKIVSESELNQQMRQKGFSSKASSIRDDIALYAISQGIDGWYSGNYTMMVNRGALTASSKTKHAGTYRTTATGRVSKRNGKPVLNPWGTWDSAPDA